MWILLLKGGILIWPIVACSLISVAIIVEKLVYLHRVGEGEVTGIQAVRRLLLQGHEEDARVRCTWMKGPVGRLLREVLAHRHLPAPAREEVLSQAAQEELELLERHLSALDIIGHIAPLLGLLGTVVGMIRVFISLERVGGPVDPGMLAGGIWEALITTAAGLAVAAVGRDALGDGRPVAPPRVVGNHAPEGVPVLGRGGHGVRDRGRRLGLPDPGAVPEKLDLVPVAAQRQVLAEPGRDGLVRVRVGVAHRAAQSVVLAHSPPLPPRVAGSDAGSYPEAPAESSEFRKN